MGKEPRMEGKSILQERLKKSGPGRDTGETRECSVIELREWSSGGSG